MSPQEPTSLAVSPGWRWGTRAGAAGALVLVGADLFRAAFPQLWDPCARWSWLNVVYFPLFLFPYLWVLWEMRGTGRRRGLVTAVSWGAVMLAVCVLLWGWWASEGVRESATPWFLVAAVVHAGLVGSALGALFTGGGAAGLWSEILKGLLRWGAYFVAVVAVSAAAASATIKTDRGAESTVVGSLRTLNTALVTYVSTHPEKGFPPDLAALGPGGENLIEEAMAGNRFSKHGYDFAYEPGPVDAEGRIATYSVTAHPVRLGPWTCRSFFTDQSAVIRFAPGGQVATAEAPPL